MAPGATFVAASNLALVAVAFTLFVVAIVRGELQPLEHFYPTQGGPWLRAAHRTFGAWSLYSFTELIPMFKASGLRLGITFHVIHHLLRAFVLVEGLGRGLCCCLQTEVGCMLFMVHQMLMKLTYDLKFIPKHTLYKNFLYCLYGTLSPHRAVSYTFGYLEWRKSGLPPPVAVPPPAVLTFMLTMEVVVTIGFLTGYPVFVKQELLPYLRGHLDQASQRLFPGCKFDDVSGVRPEGDPAHAKAS